MRDIPIKADDVGDTLPATDFNASQTEIENTVTSTDQTLDAAGGPDTDLSMLAKAVAVYGSAGELYQDSGSPNTYVLSRSNNLKPIPSYIDGVTVTFVVGGTNTGASTINISGIGAKSLTFQDGSALHAGALTSGGFVRATYNLSSDRFETIGSILILAGNVQIAGKTLIDTSTLTHPLPFNYMGGLTIANNTTDAQHDIDFSTGVCRDSTDTYNMELSSLLTKRIDAAWVVGNNNGGLFVGSVTANNWYHCFIIRKDSDGTIDAGFDVSVTAANIPSGYTAYRRVGSILTDGSSNIYGFYQIGSLFKWSVKKASFSAAGSASPQDITVQTPSGIQTIAHLSGTINNGMQANLYNENEDVSIGSSYYNCGGTGGVANAYQVDAITNTASTVKLISTTIDTVYVATEGWTDLFLRNN